MSENFFLDNPDLRFRLEHLDLALPKGDAIDEDQGLWHAHPRRGASAEEHGREFPLHATEVRSTPSPTMRALRPPRPFRKASAPGPNAWSIQ